jgi:hypothetical protein
MKESSRVGKLAVFKKTTRPNQERCPMAQDYREAGVEPSVEDLMSDPIVHLILRRDRITPADTWAAVTDARRRLRRQRARTARPATLTQDAA